MGDEFWHWHSKDLCRACVDELTEFAFIKMIEGMWDE